MIILIVAPGGAMLCKLLHTRVFHRGYFIYIKGIQFIACIFISKLNQ